MSKNRSLDLTTFTYQNPDQIKSFIHDVSNPLTVAQFNLDMLYTKFDPHKQKELFKLLELALNGVRQVSKMVITIKQELNEHIDKQSFYVNAEIQKVIEIFSYELKKYNIQVSIKSGIDITLFNNPVIFQKIILNLLTNSIDAVMLSNGLKKKISVSLRQKESAYQIRIEDNGIGMTDYQLQSVMNSNNSYKLDGLGAGLSIVKTCLAKYFKGTLECESRLGKGTVFKLFIPSKM